MNGFRLSDADVAEREDVARLVGITSGGKVVLVEDTFFPLVQTGNVKLTPSAANAADSADVTFPTEFPGVPNVVLTPWATNLSYCVIGGITSTGFKINFKRSSAAQFSVYWIAACNL